MSRIKVSVLLQIVFQWMVAAQVDENVTLPSNWNSSLPGTNTSRVLPSGYVEFPEIGFAYKMIENMMTYNEARKKCLSENGQMAVIDTREKIEKIMNYFRPTFYLSIGLVRAWSPTEWTTVDGKSTSNLPWAEGEPTGRGSCVFSSRRTRVLWNEGCIHSNYVLCEIALPTK